jgi:hypothetical protein
LTGGSPRDGLARVLAAALVTVPAMTLATVLAGSAPAMAASGDAVGHAAHPARPLAAFPDGPPARVTGGFGEDTCAACHFTFDDHPPAGRLDVAGFPDCYVGGEGYDLVVRLEDPDMAVAGFQLAVRAAADATQAGELAAGNDGQRVTVQVDRDVAFAQHTLDGATPTAPGKARWHVRWTAPPGHRPVALHAAALAGDGDRSQEGDRTYRVEQVADGKSCR